MNINITLIGQMITFAIFVWFTLKFVWPPVTKAMQERQQTIADGIAAGERGHHELELAQQRAVETLQGAKEDASKIIDQAKVQADQIVEDAKNRARDEGARLLEAAQKDIAQAQQQAHAQLRAHVVDVALLGAEKLLAKNMDDASNRQLVQAVINEVGA